MTHSFPTGSSSELRGVCRVRGAQRKQYLKNITTHDLNFGIGPAGTGKTYLAVASAVHALERDRVRRIVLVRPAVEAGEKRSEEHTSELQSLMRNSYAVFCLKKKTKQQKTKLKELKKKSQNAPTTK